LEKKGSGYEILVEDGNEYSLVELVFSLLFGVYSPTLKTPGKPKGLCKSREPRMKNVQILR
jgi:hypothetical protein